MIHKSVLTEELISNLNLRPGMTVVDGTLGAGGHSKEVLRKILPGGTLVSMDLDVSSVRNFKNFITKQGIAVSANRIISAKTSQKAHRKTDIRTSPAPVASNAYDEIISDQALLPLFSGDKIVGYWCGAQDNYSNLNKIIRGLKLEKPGAAFVDLGFSSDQMEEAARGFSFAKEGPLDMRYDRNAPLKAADIVNKYPEKKLEEIFKKYGEERYAKVISRKILNERKRRMIATTKDLVEIISRVVPVQYKKGKIHFATRVFQALRIEVNKELGNLTEFLDQATNALASEGRLAVISFHSLEDRIVKDFFRKESKKCLCPANFPKCACDHQPRLRIVTKKPIIPGEKEIKENPRSRSAKLRIVERL